MKKGVFIMFEVQLLFSGKFLKNIFYESYVVSNNKIFVS